MQTVGQRYTFNLRQGRMYLPLHRLRAISNYGEKKGSGQNTRVVRDWEDCSQAVACPPRFARRVYFARPIFFGLIQGSSQSNSLIEILMHLRSSIR